MNFKLCVIAILIFSIFLSNDLMANKNKKTQSGQITKNTDTSFEQFWKDFRLAIVNGDKSKVADLTNFPFKIWSAATNETKLINKDVFLEHFKTIFIQGKSEIKKNKTCSFYKLEDVQNTWFAEFCQLKKGIQVISLDTDGKKGPGVICFAKIDSRWKLVFIATDYGVDVI